MDRIELTNVQVMNAYSALSALKSEGAEFETVYKLGQNMKALRATGEDYQTARREIYIEHCELDELGDPQIDEGTNRYVFKSDDDRRAAIEKIGSLDKAVMSVDLYTFPLKAFAKTKNEHAAFEHLGWLIQAPAADTGEKPAPKRRGR
jgi:hypothetical protein